MCLVGENVKKVIVEDVEIVVEYLLTSAIFDRRKRRNVSAVGEDVEKVIVEDVEKVVEKYLLTSQIRPAKT